MSSNDGNGNGVLLCSLHSGAGRVLTAASILLSLPPYFDATKQTVGRHQKGASSSDNCLPPALFGVHVSSVVGALNGLENLGCPGRPRGTGQPRGRSLPWRDLEVNEELSDLLQLGERPWQRVRPSRKLAHT